LPSATHFAGAVFLTALLASPVRADENLAGTGSVAEWRTKLGRSELATAAYAAGVMATGNLFSECKNPRTVRDLHTYLLYRAPSTLTMKQAIGSFFSEGDCMFFGEDRLAPSNPPNWKTKATIYSEEP
jgi:hypothetical protein